MSVEPQKYRPDWDEHSTCTHHAELTEWGWIVCRRYKDSDVKWYCGQHGFSNDMGQAVLFPYNRAMFLACSLNTLHGNCSIKPNGSQ